MADKLISQLGARAAVLTTDLMPLEPIAGPPAEKGAISQLITLLDTIYVKKIGDTMTGLLTIAQATANTSVLTSTGYSLTGANAQNMLDFAGTWNTSGNPTALRIAITNTASGATAKFLEFFAGAGGATSVFSVNKAGVMNIGGSTSAFPQLAAFTNSFGDAGLSVRRADGTVGLCNLHVGDIFTVGNAITDASDVRLFMTSLGTGGAISMGSGCLLRWSSLLEGSGTGINASSDLVLGRDAADTLALIRTTNAQTFRWYRTFTDSTNYERGSLRTAAGQVIVAAETAGTGTDDIDLVLTPAGAGLVTLPGGATLLKTTAALTDVAGVGVGTLTNAPTAGNPTKWCQFNDNGTLRKFPTWP